MTGQNLKPFISSQLEVTSSQIEFRTKTGNRAFGYADELLPEVCDVFIKADRARVLTHNQEHIAERARIIMKGLARLGIAGLIDEATGYQEVRDKQALQMRIFGKNWRRGLSASRMSFTNTSFGYVAGNGRGAARTRRRLWPATRKTSCMRGSRRRF